MVHQCTKFHCERTHHKQVIGTITFHKFFCLRLFVVVYKLVISVLMNSYHGTSVYEVSLLEDLCTIRGPMYYKKVAYVCKVLSFWVFALPS